MRTTPAEHAFDHRSHDVAHDEPVLARDNPRRRWEHHNEREDDDRHVNRTNRSPLRHGVQHVRDDLRRLTRG
jgi:hypothetical protein